jgi:hypothetical protein
VRSPVGRTLTGSGSFSPAGAALPSPLAPPSPPPVLPGGEVPAGHTSTGNALLAMGGTPQDPIMSALAASSGATPGNDADCTLLRAHVVPLGPTAPSAATA